MVSSISSDTIASTWSTASTATTASAASFTSLLRGGTLPVSFILLCLLHLVHSNSYHLFDYISANFLQLKYNTSIMHSAVLSSITSCFAIVLCPIAGYVLDHTGYKSASLSKPLVRCLGSLAACADVPTPIACLA